MDILEQLAANIADWPELLPCSAAVSIAASTVTQAHNEIERLRRIATAAEYVYGHFKDDLTQGFKTRDKTFAVEVLGPPLGL